MRRALELAAAAMEAGEVPIGAVVTYQGRIVGEGQNRNLRDHDPTAHAEIVAIREAAAGARDNRLTGRELWVTLEPCAMCAGAISHARLSALYFGASDPKGGGVLHGGRIFAQPQCHHRPDIYPGIGEDQAAELLRGFFGALRASGSDGSMR